MPWNFQIFRVNASGDNVGAVPKAQLLLSSELSQTPVFIGFSDTMSGVQKFRILSEAGRTWFTHATSAWGSGGGAIRIGITIRITMGTAAESAMSRPPM
jgi:hypothetical protein